MAIAAIITAAILVLIYYVYRKISRSYTYWEERRVKAPKPDFIFGNFKEVAWTQTHSYNSLLAQKYTEFPDEKVFGLYLSLKPVLVLRDPDIVKTVLVKDFDSFNDIGVNSTRFLNLAIAKDEQWKILRKKFTPIFSLSKVKAMVPGINSCVEEYIESLRETVDGINSMDVYKLNRKCTMKLIMMNLVSLDVDLFDERRKTFGIHETSSVFSFLKHLENFIPALRSLRGKYGTRTETLIKLFKETLKQRKGKSGKTRDMMNLLIELKEQGFNDHDKEKMGIEIDDEFIIANTFLFYIGGFDTPSSAMSFMMYELALNPDIQAHCFTEIDAVMKKYNEKLDYQAVQELQYLTMVFSETLRKYPVGGITRRQALTDYTFKDIDLTIKRGTKVWISSFALQRDPKYYPDPEKFDPERFNKENKSKQHVYMPFGIGPRNCAGLLLGRTQVLVTMAHFLHKFRVTPSDQTPKKIQFEPRNPLFTLASKGGIWLNVEKRDIE